MTNIFIANLDWEISSSDLQATFSAFGEVHLAHVVFDAKTKKSKGFGYVEMVSAEEAIKAIMALNGFEVNGRKLDVKIASPKANRPKPEDKPKPAFTKKPGGFGGKKPYNSGGGQRQGGGGYGGNSGGFRSNNNNSGGGYRSNEGGGYRSNSNEGGGYRSSSNEGGGFRSSEGRSESKPENRDENRPERVLRPRKPKD